MIELQIQSVYGAHSGPSIVRGEVSVSQLSHEVTGVDTRLL